VHLPLQRKMRELSPCRAVYGLDSDHAPQLSNPDGLVELFLKAVSEHARRCAATRTDCFICRQSLSQLHASFR